MALYPLIFLKGEARGKSGKNPTRMLVHENIHLDQQQELLLLFFYILYIGEEYFRAIVLRKEWEEAYMQNSFEREAYDNQTKKSYIQNRKAYAWIEYLFKEP